jgi:hypothetical protein
MRPYNLADLTALRQRLPGFMRNVIFTQIVGYTIDEDQDGYWLLSPFEDEPRDVRRRGPAPTKREAWALCPNWSFQGPLVLAFMKRVCRPDALTLRGTITEEILAPVYADGKLVDAVYIEHIEIKWRLRGSVYSGRGIEYGDAAMDCYIDYLMRPFKRTGPLPETAETSI